MREKYMYEGFIKTRIGCPIHEFNYCLYAIIRLGWNIETGYMDLKKATTHKPLYEYKIHETHAYRYFPGVCFIQAALISNTAHRCRKIPRSPAVHALRIPFRTLVAGC